MFQSVLSSTREGALGGKGVVEGASVEMGAKGAPPSRGREEEGGGGSSPRQGTG